MRVEPGTYCGFLEDDGTLSDESVVKWVEIVQPRENPSDERP